MRQLFKYWDAFFQTISWTSLFGVATAAFLSLGCQGPQGSQVSGAYLAKSGRLDIEGPAAQELIRALTKAGLRDTEEHPETSEPVTELKAQNITCERAIGPKSLPKCWMRLFDGSVMSPPPSVQAELYEVLLKSGALHSGPEASKAFAVAEDLICIHKETSGQIDVSSCTLSVNLPQPYNIGGA